MCKEASRPFPRLSDDDVVDFIVAEAIAIKVSKEDEAEIERRKKEDWKKDRAELHEHVG